MKAKLVSRYDSKHEKGFEVEIDKILYDERYAGHYKIRVTNLRKRPVWLAVSWILNKHAEWNVVL